MATKTQEASATVDTRMTTGKTYDIPEVKLGSRILEVTLIGGTRMGEKAKEWETKNTDFTGLYASSYFLAPTWNPYLLELSKEERSSITNLFKQDPGKGAETLLNQMSKYERPSVWASDQNDMHDWVLEQLSNYKDGKGYYYDAAKFYEGLVKSQKGVMSLVTDKETGEILGSTFIITGKACIENSTNAAKKIFARKMDNMGASPENTLYTAEMFISPELHGSARAGTLIRLMLGQSLQWANANGFTHVMSWTPGEKEDEHTPANERNPIMGMEAFFNFVDLEQEAKGLDVKMGKDGTVRFAKSPDGPAQWGGNAISKLNHTGRL